MNTLQTSHPRWRVGVKACLHSAFLIALSVSSVAQASSVASITSSITFTLTGIEVGGVPAADGFDYEADGGIESGGFFDEIPIFGGTGSTSGIGSSFHNATLLDPGLTGDPVAVGDTFTLESTSEATADTAIGIQRNQFESISFAFSNFTDDGFGDTETLSFLFDYTLTYTTSLTNDVAGDSAFTHFLTTITTFDDGLPTETILELFPDSTPAEITELHFGAGTIMPSGGTSGSFSLDLTEGGFFDFTSTATAVGNINTAPVPIPPAVWLFISGLLGLVGIARRQQI